MFLGSFEHSLDEKSRVVFPLGFRKNLSEEKLKAGFVLEAGTKNKFIELLPTEEWLRQEEKLEERYAQGDEKAEEYLIDLHSSAVNVELDKQYRFLLPEASRKVAGIVRDVVFIGMGRKIVIYAKERWEERQRKRKESMTPPPPTGKGSGPGAGSEREGAR